MFVLPLPQALSLPPDYGMVYPIVREVRGVLCERWNTKKREQDGKLGELVAIYDVEKARN